jgi:predicted ribosomally synthesized peptide with SipW-like signal peptide
MNKKIISLVFLLILLVSVTVSYAYFNQSTTIDNHQTNPSGDITQDTLTTEIDSTFLNETQGIEIGEMI